MAEHNEIGITGEEVASQYLEQLGYLILEKNWRIQRAEIDIIARWGDVLICIEVKTRTTDHFGEPYEFISRRKMRMLVDALTMYSQQIGHDGELRFDVMSIISFHPQSHRIMHMEDAFFPTFW